MVTIGILLETLHKITLEKEEETERERQTHRETHTETERERRERQPHTQERERKMFVWNCFLEVSRPRREEGIFFKL